MKIQSNVSTSNALVQHPLVNQPDPATLPALPDQPTVASSPAAPLAKLPIGALATSPTATPVASLLINVTDTVRHDQLALAPIMRIQSIVAKPVPGKLKTSVTAVLFHESVSLCVTWTTDHHDHRLHSGSVVEIRRAKRDLNDGKGALIIDRLVLREQPDTVTNLFKTIPHSWVADRVLVNMAINFWERLPRPLAFLLNAVFWEGGRFQRYVRCPSSLNGHHNRVCGNFEHSVDVVRRALRMAEECSDHELSLLIFGGLMHDAGKADEYDPSSKAPYYRFSLRGSLVGHHQTLIEWLAVAQKPARGIITDKQYLLIANMLTSHPKTPDYLAIRKPATSLSSILSAADRMSGEADLLKRSAPTSEDGGKGTYHSHLGCSAFALSSAEAEAFRCRPAANDPSVGDRSAME